MTATPRTADELRSAFTGFFAERGHQIVPSASLIPHDPTVLFTVAGMVPFKPYFVGDETPPYKRAVTSQKCARAGGKHNDLDDVGRTKRHLVVLRDARQLQLRRLLQDRRHPDGLGARHRGFGFDGDRLWITFTRATTRPRRSGTSRSACRWTASSGSAQGQLLADGRDRSVRPVLGDPHRPRPGVRRPDGGPARRRHGDRFIEIWNLVFMQYNQAPDGTRTCCRKPSIDTGAGLERILCLMQGVDAVWETDLMLPLIDQACSLTGKRYVAGDYDDRDSFAMRVLAEHARSSTMLVSDGVFPSNEGRGYVLRRIIRRAVRYAYLLGTEQLVMPKLVDTAIDVMGNAYPDVAKQRDFVVGVLTREEERFRQTLKTGLAILEDELVTNTTQLPGTTAFTLHDTYGFPLELTEEIAGERGVTVDGAGFDAEMRAQRERAKAARKGNQVDDDRLDAYREVVEQFGTTEFVGYSDDTVDARVLAVLPGTDEGTVEIFLDRTPFYAESGGQVGDTGTITGPSGTAEVLDTTFALPGLRRHTAKLISGELSQGATVTAAIDVERRDATRRNHTGTHLLHHALRLVLGDHVKQAGSLVGPDRLRFDFSHYAPVTPDEIERIEAIVNHETLANAPARAFETTKDEALAMGAMAFFGDKYGDIVRVLEVGSSIELCGGTHVKASGDIGIVKVVSEASIGSNLRRIEAVTGANTLALLQRDEHVITDVARLVGASTDDVVTGVQRRLDEIKALQDELKVLRAQLATGRASELAGSADGGVVVERVDGLSPNDLRELAIAVRQQPGVDTVVLVGVSDSGGVSLVGAVTPGSGKVAGNLIKDAAKAVGGGGGGKGDIATAGGKNVDGIDEALRIAKAAATS
jgi:alanyl-tRNA synthetase